MRVMRKGLNDKYQVGKKRTCFGDIGRARQGRQVYAGKSDKEDKVVAGAVGRKVVVDTWAVVRKGGEIDGKDV